MTREAKCVSVPGSILSAVLLAFDFLRMRHLHLPNKEKPPLLKLQMIERRCTCTVPLKNNTFNNSSFRGLSGTE